MIKNFKSSVTWTYAIWDFNGKENFRMFRKKELQKTNEKKFRSEKVIQRKGHKLYVKWKGYNSLFNSWIDKKIMLYKMGYFPEP